MRSKLIFRGSKHGQLRPKACLPAMESYEPERTRFERMTRKQPRPAAQGIGTTKIFNKFWLSDIEMFVSPASPAVKP